MVSALTASAGIFAMASPAHADDIQQQITSYVSADAAPDAPAVPSAPAKNSPPPGVIVSGPGCPQTNPNHDDWDTHGVWSKTGGDYTGPQILGGGGGNCNGTSYYILDQAKQTALFRWHLETDTSEGISCHLWAYIPSQLAGDRHARYDFYADDGAGGLVWLGWPGHTIDQEITTGWTDLGGVNVPPNTFLLTVILNNQDTKAPGWPAGAGDITSTCNG